MIKITFNKKFRIFPKGYVAKFDTDKIILVGDNGSGKSTLMLLVVAKLFEANKINTLHLRNILRGYWEAIEDADVTVELDKTPLPVVMDENDFNNDTLVNDRVGGISSLIGFIESSSLSTGEKKFDEVLDNISVSRTGYKDIKVNDGVLLFLDEPDANLGVVNILKLKKELEAIDKYFIICHNSYMIAKEKEVYALRLGSNGLACRPKKISGKEYIKMQEEIFMREVGYDIKI